MPLNIIPVIRRIAGVLTLLPGLFMGLVLKANALRCLKRKCFFLQLELFWVYK